MTISIPKKYLLIIFFVFVSQLLSAQTVRLVDGRQSFYCESCIQLINEKPKEILFGVQISKSGEVYFSINNKEWFHKFLTQPTDGISIDLVAKDQYACNLPTPGKVWMQKGKALPIVYLAELNKRSIDLGGGNISIFIGNIPADLKNKEVEGNLAIIRNGVVCYYTFFANIDRTLWELLPMGLFTDTLINTIKNYGADTEKIFYSKKLQFTIPFLKNTSQYNAADIKPLYDSLKLSKFIIKKIVIRTYSSVEGSENANLLLQKQRANSMVKALQQYQSSIITTEIQTSENWIEFYNDVGATNHPELANLSKPDVKKKLLDKTITADLEPILKKQRKAIVTIYLTQKSNYQNFSPDNLAEQFKDAIQKKDIESASGIQKEIFERISDNKLPTDYLDKLEIPNEKIFSFLLNSNITYKYELDLFSVDEAINNLKLLLQTDPDNARVRYNICSLTLGAWQYDTSFINSNDLLSEINSLKKYTIPESLVKRMLVNYHIIISEIYMMRYNYKAKDESLQFIKENYQDLELSDADLLAMAKYFCYYARCDWSLELLSDRAAKIDVNEDLLFYYINLQLFEPETYDLPEFKEAVANAIVIDKQRFCKLFNSVNNGGASFQLLDNDELRETYCNSCAQ